MAMLLKQHKSHRDVYNHKSFIRPNSYSDVSRSVSQKKKISRAIEVPVDPIIQEGMLYVSAPISDPIVKAVIDGMPSFNKAKQKQWDEYDIYVRDVEPPCQTLNDKLLTWLRDHGEVPEGVVCHLDPKRSVKETAEEYRRRRLMSAKQRDRAKNGYRPPPPAKKCVNSGLPTSMLTYDQQQIKWLRPLLKKNRSLFGGVPNVIPATKSSYTLQQEKPEVRPHSHDAVFINKASDGTVHLTASTESTVDKNGGYMPMVFFSHLGDHFIAARKYTNWLKKHTGYQSLSPDRVKSTFDHGFLSEKIDLVVQEMHRDIVQAHRKSAEARYVARERNKLPFRHDLESYKAWWENATHHQQVVSLGFDQVVANDCPFDADPENPPSHFASWSYAYWDKRFRTDIADRHVLLDLGRSEAISIINEMEMLNYDVESLTRAWKLRENHAKLYTRKERVALKSRNEDDDYVNWLTSRTRHQRVNYDRLCKVRYYLKTDAEFPSVLYGEKVFGLGKGDAKVTSSTRGNEKKPSTGLIDTALEQKVFESIMRQKSINDLHNTVLYHNSGIVLVNDSELISKILDGAASTKELLMH